MALYKFRVTFEDLDDVYRDIEIKSNQTFEDLHKGILQSIGFDNKHEASFFMSNDYWKKGKEITLKDNGNGTPLMNVSKLAPFILDPHQKILYTYDYNAMWNFYVELIKILPKEEESVTYPRVVKSAGTAPKQYGATNLGKVSSDFDFLDEEGLDGAEDEDEERLDNDEENDTNSGDEDMDEFGFGEYSEDDLRE